MKIEMLSHSTDGLPVDPGQLVTMVCKHDRYVLLPHNVGISSFPDAAWEIVRLAVGVNDQRIENKPIPIHGGVVIMEPAELAQFFRFDPIGVGTYFTMDIVNCGRVRSPFAARWHCEVFTFEANEVLPPATTCMDTWKGTRLTKPKVCEHGYDWACPHGRTEPTPYDPQGMAERTEQLARRAQREAFRPERIKIKETKAAPHPPISGQGYTPGCTCAECYSRSMRDMETKTRKAISDVRGAWQQIVKRPPNVPFRPATYEQLEGTAMLPEREMLSYPRDPARMEIVPCRGEHYAVDPASPTGLAPWSEIAHVPPRTGRPPRITKPHPGWGWDPEGEG